MGQGWKGAEPQPDGSDTTHEGPSGSQHCQGKAPKLKCSERGCCKTGSMFVPMCGYQSIHFISVMQGLFRIAAGASKLKKLKAALDCSTSQLDEFYSDPHAVAGIGSVPNPNQV